MKRLIAILGFSCMAASAAEPGTQSASLVIAGTVLEARDAGTYSYLRLQTADGETWAAVPAAALSCGAKVTIEDAALMTDFESRSLGRTFERIVFGVLAGDKPGAESARPPSPHTLGVNPIQAAVNVTKAEGPAGYRVAEIVSQRTDLGGQTVVVRGQVVKYNAGVMGRNWLHLRDGSGSETEKTNDLLVTINEEARLGEVVTVQGTVAVNKDFGAGYSYRVLVEGALLK